MNRRVLLPAAVVLVSLAALAATKCDRSGEPAGPAPAVGTPSPPAPLAERRTYAFTWRGDAADLPWNRSLWLTVTEGGKRLPAVPLIFFEDEERAVAAARPGEPWSIHSEQSPNRAMDALLHAIRAEGTFGDPDEDPAAATIAVHLPKRTAVLLTGDETLDPGSDLLTAALPDGPRLAARRGSLEGLDFAVWDASQPAGREDWRLAEQQAPRRPWRFAELRAGTKMVIAGKSGKRRWIARSVVLEPGETVTLDVAAQPEGGGTVLCDDAGSELLLGGELPIPAMRLVDPFLRARWENVPPGRHSVRRGDGRVEEIEVIDGGEVRLPK